MGAKRSCANAPIPGTSTSVATRTANALSRTQRRAIAPFLLIKPMSLPGAGPMRLVVWLTVRRTRGAPGAHPGCSVRATRPTEERMSMHLCSWVCITSDTGSQQSRSRIRWSSPVSVRCLPSNVAQTQQCRLLFPPTRRRTEPKGPCEELVDIDKDKDVVRRVLATHSRPVAVIAR